MKILGIDPGLNLTGYGIIETTQGRPRFVDAGYIHTSAKDPIEQRLLKIHRELTDIITAHELDVVILEKLFAHYKHPLTACWLGHARGVICLTCVQKGIRVLEYAPTRVKKIVLGRGHAAKMQIKQIVLNTLGLTGGTRVPLDVTDALSLALAHSYTLKRQAFAARIKT